jgi:hypothetical protein
VAATLFSLLLLFLLLQPSRKRRRGGKLFKEGAGADEGAFGFDASIRERQPTTTATTKTKALRGE